MRKAKQEWRRSSNTQATKRWRPSGDGARGAPEGRPRGARAARGRRARSGETKEIGPEGTRLTPQAPNCTDMADRATGNCNHGEHAGHQDAAKAKLRRSRWPGAAPESRSSGACCTPSCTRMGTGSNSCRASRLGAPFDVSHYVSALPPARTPVRRMQPMHARRSPAQTPAAHLSMRMCLPSVAMIPTALVPDPSLVTKCCVRDGKWLSRMRCAMPPQLPAPWPASSACGYMDAKPMLSR